MKEGKCTCAYFFYMLRKLMELYGEIGYGIKCGPPSIKVQLRGCTSSPTLFLMDSCVKLRFCRIN